MRSLKSTLTALAICIVLASIQIECQKPTATQDGDAYGYEEYDSENDPSSAQSSSKTTRNNNEGIFLSSLSEIDPCASNSNSPDCVNKRSTRKVSQGLKLGTGYKIANGLLNAEAQAISNGNGGYLVSSNSGSGSSNTDNGVRFSRVFCELAKDPGVLCPQIRRGTFLQQFYYDSDSNSCSPFVYNGCGGNSNRFSSIWQCTMNCVKNLQ